MGRTSVALLVVSAALAVGAWARSRSTRGAAFAANTPSTSTSTTTTTTRSTTTATPTPTLAQPPLDLSTETALMARLRTADPATVLDLVKDVGKRFPGGSGAEEREARKIDALVALDRIGEAHTDAMLFVQHHPSGPFSQHIMNLMGVHPRPPGTVPEPPPEAD